MLTKLIKQAAIEALANLFPELTDIENQISINQTKPEFEGDYTIVLFPFIKQLKKNPIALGNELGAFLINKHATFSTFQVVSGFLNLTISDAYWLHFLTHQYNQINFGEDATKAEKVMVEFSSPNTNKPLHFGHLRNIFLGAAFSSILKANGKTVIKANLINDRGIHICKSMVAWMRYGNGATPQSTQIKGDHLVGDYYVKFNEVYKAEIKELIEKGVDEKTAEKQAPIMIAAQELLRKWEDNEAETKTVWAEMNSWVYAGFDKTYQKLGISFDKIYYESQTYLLGKKMVQEGLEKKVLFEKEDGSVWIDLTAEGLDQKLLLRGDGTSVYITQDMGTARLKYNDCNGLQQSIYVIADEQNYHIQVLKFILQKLEEPCAEGVYHLSYGMVELPTGKMKSREGTVVDADDMIAEMTQLAKEQTENSGKTEGFTEPELNQLYEIIGLGALKFYLLRVDPKKKMVFNPQESIDLHGFTATFIQYAHARICSILRKEKVSMANPPEQWTSFSFSEKLLNGEKNLLLYLENYPEIMTTAAESYNPSILCNYCFKLAQLFNSFYDLHSISKAESEEKKTLRLMLIIRTAHTLKHAFSLLGIDVPEKM